MTLKILSLVTLLSFALTSCKEASRTVAVAGDSWSVFVCNYKSLDKAFAAAGVQDAATHATCALTTDFGMRAERWLASSYHERTLKTLKDKSVKVLYLSLGGNDILNYWRKDLTAAQEREVFDTLKSILNEIIHVYQKVRPDVKILISGYDFPRFTPNHPISAYKRAYENMGSPTAQEINSMMIRFSESMQDLADQKSVFYIQHHGLMQYYLGNKEEGLQAFTTLSPDLISSEDQPARAGGDINLLSDKEAMQKIGPAIDAFHLSKFGYEKIGDHVVSIYLKKWL